MTTIHAPRSGEAPAPPAPAPPSPGSGLPLTSLLPPPAGALSIPVQQLAGQAVVAGTITAMLPIDIGLYQSLSLEQLVALIRMRLAALESSGVVTAGESAALHQRFDAVRRGDPVRRPRADRSVPPSAVTVAGILAAVAPPDTTQDFDLGSFFSDALAVLEGALMGLAIGGIPGAIAGGMTAYQMLQAEDGFLTA